MTTDQLMALSKKELADRAKRMGVAGWEAMRKEELVKTLLAQAKRAKRSAPKAAAAKPKLVKSTTRKPATLKTKQPKTLVRAKTQTAAARDTSATPSVEEQVE